MATMLRILHCYKSYMPEVFGGVADAIATVTSEPDADFDHSILVSRSQGLGRDFVFRGSPIHAVVSLGTVASCPVAPTYPFALALRARFADLIVYHSPFPLTDLGLLLGVSKKTPLIVHWHADLLRSGIATSAIKPLLRHTLKRADRIIVPHESLMLSSPYLQGFSEKCVVIPYGVDFAYWAHLSSEEEEKVAEIRRSHPRLIVSTGRLVAYKGQQVLLTALQQIDATLCIIGTGVLATQLHEQIRELGLSSRATLTGRQEREQIKILLHAARTFAFPSLTLSESFGIAQLEAMAAGLPVVNTALATAVPHIARHGVEGLTVPPGDAVALASALTRLLDDKELAEKFGRAAQDRANKHFDRATVVDLPLSFSSTRS